MVNSIDRRNPVPKEWYSPVSISTYIGTAVACLAYVAENINFSLFVLTVVVVMLFITNIVVYKKYQAHKLFSKIDEDMHRLTHNTRNHILELRCITGVYEAEEKSAAAVRAALTTASNIFSILTGTRCTASLMLEKKDGLVTIQYCHQVTPERENKRSGILSKADGMAGEALSTGDVVTWDCSTKTFKQIRPDSQIFYKSGLCAPFKVGSSYAGLMNIDSMSDSVFEKARHKQIAASLADQVGVIMEALHLYKELSDA